jgi:hypothetical protein
MAGKIALFILMTFAASFYASTQSIKGHIKNSNGEPIPFASIYVPKLSTGTTSNLEGNYELKIPEGK